MPRSRYLWLMLILPTLLVIGVVWQTDWPLGVPGEWTWDRVPPAEPWFLAIIPPTIAAIIYMTLIWLAAPRLARGGAVATWLRLGGLTLAGFAWLCVVQESAPHLNQLSKAGYVLYFRGPSGYFSQARYDVKDLQPFLADYNRLMSQGEVLHIGTHPPGLIVVFRGLIRLCESSPALSQLLLESQPPSVVAAFNDIASSAHPREPLRQTDRAALWLAFLLVQFTAAAAVVPLYALLRRTRSPRIAWLAASFWPAVPAVAIFLPKSDVLFAGLGVFLGWLWLEGCRTEQHAARRSIYCFAAGAHFWGGLTMSLALLPVGFLLAVATLGRFFEEDPIKLHHPVGVKGRRLVVSLLIAAAAFLLLCFVVWRQLGLNLFETWRWNYVNHAGFYKLYTRTYFKWLAVNPLEFAVAAGVPLILLAAASVFRPGCSLRRPGVSLFWALAITWGILWLSGKNMGEAARLWAFLTPWLIFPAADTLASASVDRDPRQQEQNEFRLWGVAIACQFAVSIGLVLRVVGFPLPFPMPPA